MRLRVLLSALLLVFTLCALGPPAIAQNAQNSGSIPASPGTGCVGLDVSSSGMVGISVTGTWTGTLQAQIAIGGDAPQNVQVTPYTSNTPQATITANGAFNALIGGATYFQLCGASVATGTAKVQLNAVKLAARTSVGGGAVTGMTQGQPTAGTAAGGITSSAASLDTIGFAGLANLVNTAITAGTLGQRVNESMLETFATNPMPDNGFFKVSLPSGNGSNAAWTQSAPTVLRGGNWLIGNGRKGQNTSSDWIGTRMIPSNSFPDGIAPPAGTVAGHTCTGSAGSMSAGSYLVSEVFVDNLQTYTGTSTVLPGQTNSGTEAIVTCGANGTVNFPAQTVAGTPTAAGFGNVSGVQMFLAPTVNVTTSLATTGASCAATPASCNVAVVVSALTNASWARDFAVGENVIMDVGASQETQKIVAIDFANSKLVFQGPILFAHTANYPIAPSQSETLQNSTSAGASNAGAVCTGSNASNAAYGSFFACALSSGSSVSVTPTLTASIFNSNAPIPLINYTAPQVVFGSTGLQGTAEFDQKLISTQVSCRRPNGTIVARGLGWVNLNSQEHGFAIDDFVRDCPNAGFIFGNNAQNSSMQGVNEFNDGCAAAVTAFGCTGGAAAVTNSNYRLVVQAVSPGPLSLGMISSSSANCLSVGCNVTNFPAAVVLIDRAQTVLQAAHGEAALDVARIRNKASLHITNPSGGSSSNSTVIAAFHSSTSAASFETHNEIPQGAITGITDDIFPGVSTTTTGAMTGGSTTVLPVTSTTGLYCGQELLLDTVASGVQEYVQIVGFSTAANTLPAASQCISGGNVTLASAVVNSHGSGIIVSPLSTAIHEGTSIATAWYEVSNACSGCQNTNRDRWTSYNGVSTNNSGAWRMFSGTATDVPLQIGGGPGVTQSGDLLDMFSDNFVTNIFKVTSNGSVSAAPANGTTAWQVFKADGTTSVLDVDTTNGRLGIQASPPAAALDIAGKFQVASGTGAITRLGNQTVVGPGAPALLFNTVSATTNAGANISSQQMFAGQAGVHTYRFSWYVDQVAAGTGACAATASTIVLNLIFTDTNAAGSNTLPMVGFGPNTNTAGITTTITIATSGSPLGAAGQVAASGTYTFDGKASQAIAYTTSGAVAPASCTLVPTYAVRPILEQIQ